MLEYLLASLLGYGFASPIVNLISRFLGFGSSSRSVNDLGAMSQRLGQVYDPASSASLDNIKLASELPKFEKTADASLVQGLIKQIDNRQMRGYDGRYQQ